MAFTKITEEDMRGKGNVGRPDTPGVSTAEMQRILDELPREVVVPAFNRLINELGLTTAAGNIGAKNGTVQAHIDSKTNPHGVTAEQVDSYTKQQVGELIDQKIIALGAGDMSKAEFADGPGKVKDSTKLDGKTADQCAILEYKHSRVGNVHNFTGSGLNGKVKMTANVQPDDTVQLNGATATAYVGAEDFTDALAGEAIAGKWLTFTREGNALNFKGGGGKVTAQNLTAKNIKQGVRVIVKQGNKEVFNVPGEWNGDATDIFMNCQNIGSAGWRLQQGAHCETISMPHNVKNCVWTATQPFTARLHVVHNPATVMTPEYQDGQVVSFGAGDTITFFISESSLGQANTQMNYILFYPV